MDGFDHIGAKKNALQELLKIAAEAKGAAFKKKYAPAEEDAGEPAAELEAGLPGPEGEGSVKVEAEGDVPPELLEKLLALLGKKDEEQPGEELTSEA